MKRQDLSLPGKAIGLPLGVNYIDGDAGVSDDISCSVKVCTDLFILMEPENRKRGNRLLWGLVVFSVVLHAAIAWKINGLPAPRLETVVELVLNTPPPAVVPDPPKSLQKPKDPPKPKSVAKPDEKRPDPPKIVKIEKPLPKKPHPEPTPRQISAPTEPPPALPSEPAPVSEPIVAAVKPEQQVGRPVITSHVPPQPTQAQVRQETPKTPAKPGNDPGVKKYFSSVRNRIERYKSYPEMARRRGIEGRVVVSFVISRNGRADEIKVVESSGNASLDQAAIRAVKDASPFGAMPEAIEGNELSLEVPVLFELN